MLSQLPREVIITSTVAGRHYGVSASYVYDEMEDGGQEKIWDQFEEVHRVMKMAWYIHMVGHSHAISFTELKASQTIHRERTLYETIESSLPFFGNCRLITNPTNSSSMMNYSAARRLKLSSTLRMVRIDLFLISLVD